MMQFVIYHRKMKSTSWILYFYILDLAEKADGSSVELKIEGLRYL